MNDPLIASSWGTSLLPADYSSLASSWITKEVADAAMLRRVDAPDGAQIVGRKRGDCSGILFPYYWPGESSPFNYRLRRDNPDWMQSKDGKLKPSRKYLAAPGSSNRLYIPPSALLEQLQDLTIPVIVVEGEKKALALWRLANYQVEQPRFIPIAISGVWSWRGKTGKAENPRGERVDVHGPIPDLGRIEFSRRTVYVLFDTNVHTDTGVQAARDQLGRELASRGATVRFITLPADCGVNGVDDLLALWGPERVLELLNQAESSSAADQTLTQAQVLSKLVEEAELFHTPQGESFAQIPVHDHRETWPVRSRGFRRWLTQKFYERCGKPPGTQALQDAIGLVEAKAQFASPELPVFVRVAEQGNAISIDLCNETWEAVEITAKGWRVVAEPRVRFKRTGGLKSLPCPTPGSAITLLRDLINIGGDDNWLLCMSWLLAAFRPQGPYPILVLQGEQGSAKSTTAKLLRRLIDPSAALVRTAPRDERDLLIAATNSWVLAFDNLSAIPQWLSDALCRVATGGGFSTRELYTDSDEVFFDATRPIILNGIDYLTERPDLADRALVLNVPRIDDLGRRDEAEIYADFERKLQASSDFRRIV